MKSSEKN